MNKGVDGWGKICLRVREAGGFLDVEGYKGMQDTAEDGVTSVRMQCLRETNGK